MRDDSISAEKVAPHDRANAELLDEDVEIDDDGVSAGLANKGPYASGQSAQQTCSKQHIEGLTPEQELSPNEFLFVQPVPMTKTSADGTHQEDEKGNTVDS